MERTKDEYRAGLVRRTEYTVYRKNKSVPDSKRIKGRDNYTNFAKEFLNTIFDEMLERQGGVFIKGLGYFFNYMIPEKRAMVQTGKAPKYYFHSDLYHYFPVFLGDRHLVHWTLDRVFTRTYIEKFKERLESGKIYKNYLWTLIRINRR